LEVIIVRLFCSAFGCDWFRFVAFDLMDAKEKNGTKVKSYGMNNDNDDCMENNSIDDKESQ